MRSGATRRLTSLPLPGRTFLTNFASANGRTSEPVATPVGGVLGGLGVGAPSVVDDDDGGLSALLNVLLISCSAFLPALTASSTGMPMITAATTSDTNVVIGLRPRPPPTGARAETLG